MLQPPGGPGNAAQSAALAPLDSHKDSLTLQSQPPQPLDSNSELMSLCARFPIFLCSWLDRRQRIGSDGARGGFSKGARHRGVVCRHSMALFSGTDSYSPPLPRRPRPAGLIPVSTGLTNFTASPPTALSRHWLNPRTSPATTLSPLHTPPPCLALWSGQHFVLPPVFFGIHHRKKKRNLRVNKWRLRHQSSNPNRSHLPHLCLYSSSSPMMSSSAQNSPFLPQC